MRKSKGNILKTGKKIVKSVLSVSADILIEMIEHYEDLEYARSHFSQTFGGSIRHYRLESERLRELHRLKMRRQALERLRQQEMIALRREGDRFVYVLTESGRMRAVKDLIRTSRVMLKQGEICLVSFDIPEASEPARTTFRRFLKKSGFRYVQGSVWSTEKDVVKHMRDLVEFLKVGKWVKIYLAHN